MGAPVTGDYLKREIPSYGYLDVPAEWRDPERADVVIIPVPYDETSSWHKGADIGPAAIVEASRIVEWFDIPTGTEMCRRGIYTAPAIEHTGDPEKLAAKVAAATGKVWGAGRFPVVLGGEHSVSIGAIQECARRVPGVTVLQIDAHGDTREEYLGSRYNHACVMARARDVAPIVQVGIRAIEAGEYEQMDRSRVFFGHEIAGNPDRSWMDRVVRACGDTIYLTIDMDAFDPTLVPATGTPEPGGLSWDEVNDLVHRVVASGKRIVGFDVVELCPRAGHHASAMVAAKLVYRVLSMIFAAR